MKRLYAPLTAVLFAFVLSACSGCASTKASLAAANPFLQCHSVGQCYLATEGTYNRSQKAAIEVLHNPDTPPAVRDAIKRADAKAVPVIFELSDAYTLYVHVKADLNACATDDAPCKADANQKLINATVNLQKWITEATPLVNDLLALTGDAP